MERKRRFAASLALILCMLTVLVPLWTASGAVGGVRAAVGAKALAFDETNVLDDLRSSTVAGKPFDIRDYPYDSTGEKSRPSIINVVEYCYSYRANMRENYGLYLYVYNPQALNLHTESRANKVQMAVSYDAEGIPTAYEKFDIKFCSKSEESDYKNLFYKFRVVDRVGADGKTIAERVNSNERRYDVSGIELVTYGASNATEYGVGGTYTFTGYAAGYGADEGAGSTLTSAVREMETIFLDLAGATDGVDKRTYWRSQSSSLGKNHQNQMNSVFFAIDNAVLEKYGNKLQRIKAEWWEYKMRPAAVVGNAAVYSALKPYVGRKISTEDCDRSIPYSLGYELYNAQGGGVIHYGWSWNESLYDLSVVDKHYSDDAAAIMPLLFSANGEAVGDYVLTAGAIGSYIESYTASADRGYVEFNNHRYSADLFESNVDAGRTPGYNERVFDMANPEDYYDLKSYDSTHGEWWQKFWDYGFGGITTDDDYTDVAPIYAVTDSDLSGGNLADLLKINADDAERFRTFYADSVSAGQTVFIFRYAQTDYLSAELVVKDTSNNNRQTGIAELRQGTQFFDFDILEFTFNKAGEYHVIPVVSSPVDHISDYTPTVTPNGLSWWQLLIMVIALVVLLILCWPLIKLLVKFVVWLLGVVFAPIRWLFGHGKKEDKKDKK